MVHRNGRYKKRQFDYVPTDMDPISGLDKQLIQAPVLNAPAADYASQNIIIHINAGTGVAENFIHFGRDHCAVFVEVTFIISYGQSIGKTITQWSDADFDGFANFIVQQVGCKIVSSSFNEGYEAARPYAVDMAAMPDIAYKMQKAIALALAANGWRYLGEYSGVCYPMDNDPTMSNAEDYRTLLLNDQAAYNSLRGQPNPGTPNLRHLGDPTFATDLHFIKDCLLDKYFEPGEIYNSADAYILAGCIASVTVRNGLRFLNNTTSRLVGYFFLQRAQEHNTQFFEFPLPADVGGKFVGSNFISYDLSLQTDASVLSWILDDDQECWDNANQLKGKNPRVLQDDFRRDDGLYLRQYVAGDGPGSHNPGRAGTGYSNPFDGSEKGFVDTPMAAHDLPKEAYRIVEKMKEVAGGSTTPVWFPVRTVADDGTRSAWGKSTPDCLIDAFKNQLAFAVGFSNGVNACGYILFSFAANKKNYEVLTPGNVVIPETAAAVTGVIGYVAPN